MTVPVNMLLEHPAAAVLGLAGLTCQLIWPLFRTRRDMLSIQFCAAAGYALQYALLDQWTGTAVCAIGASQTLIAMRLGERPWLPHLGFGFIPLVWIAGYLTWSSVASGLAMTACCLIMIARMQRDTLRMRAIMLAAAPFGIAFDLAAGAAPALAGAIVSFLISLAALRREWLARQPAAARGAYPAMS